MAENRREKDPGSYRFSRGQLVILAVGFSLTSLVVFFMGILVGQRIEERKLVQKEEPLVKIPVQPLAQGTGQRESPSTKEEITFYDTLSKTPSTPSKAPAEQSKEQPKETKPVKEKAETVKEVKEKVGAVKEKQAPLDGTVVKVQEPAAKDVQQAPWAIQVNAFPHERDAQNLSQKLKKKGYDAYVVSADVQGKTWYRVRVGHFATRQESRSMQEELKTKEKLSKAITVSR